MTIKKYRIIEIQSYADKMFREGKIQVPFITELERFLNNFEDYVKTGQGELK